jgi:hypothetical protein
VHALAYQIYSPSGAGTSGANQPTWIYSAGQTVTDGTATWQVQAQNILARSAGNDIWVNSGNSGATPAMGPGGDLAVQSINVLAPISLPAGSTATTQTPATDSSNNVATDRFVQNAITAATPGAVVANWSQTGQSGNVACTSFYTPSATGMYRASAYVVVTQAATTSSTMPNAVINFTDADTGVVETSVALTGTSTTNTVGQTSDKTGTIYPTAMVFRAAAGTPVKGCTASYASSGATPMLYNVYFKLESLGP